MGKPSTTRPPASHGRHPAGRHPARRGHEFRGLLLLLCLAAQPALALPEDASQPIHIRADAAEIDQNAELVIYRGGVLVEQGTLRVTADEMTVEYRDQKVIRITARGTPAKYQQQLELGEDDVKADASTIIYHTQDEKLDLKGNAFLRQEGNEITGDFIQYDIVAGKVDAKASDQAPVRMVLQPATRPEE